MHHANQTRGLICVDQVLGEFLLVAVLYSWLFSTGTSQIIQSFVVGWSKRVSWSQLLRSYRVPFNDVRMCAIMKVCRGTFSASNRSPRELAVPAFQVETEQVEGSGKMVWEVLQMQVHFMYGMINHVVTKVVRLLFDRKIFEQDVGNVISGPEHRSR